MKDIIYREDAINIMQDKVFRNSTDEFWGAVQALSELPSVERTRWIPVSERLPKEKEIVILCTNTEHVTCGYYNGREFYSANTTMHDAWTWKPDVVAWMPLPEAYEEE